MSGFLVIDNWTLQDIDLAFRDGLSPLAVDEIVIDTRSDCHDWSPLPHSVVQIEALLGLLTNIVLRDSLIVDSEFTSVWNRASSPLQELRDTSILRPTDFSGCRNLVTEYRKPILEKLCVTSSIRDIQRANEKMWAERHDAVNPHMSALVWGGAGMLARSHVYKAPYLGHPFRQALLRQTSILPCTRDAISGMELVIGGARARLFRKLSTDGHTAIAGFNLPPVSIAVIEESGGVEQLIPVALQMRHRYGKLRKWLAEYQMALDSDDTKAIIGYKKTLDSVARSIDSEYAETPEGSTSITLGVKWLSITTPIKRPIDMVRNRFGVRAMLNNLALASSGEQAVCKLIDLFGAGHTQLGYRTQTQLMLRFSQAHRPYLP